MRPQYRRFGFIDFDAMGPIAAGDLEATDEFVIRRNGGDNVVATVSQIPGGVPDPLLLGNGTAAAPTYSYAADPDTGVFRLGTNQLAFAANGIAQFIINPTELSAVVAGGPLLRNFDSTATVPNIVSDSGDVDTGIGAFGPNALSLIAGGVEIARAAEGTNDQFLVLDGSITGPAYSFISDPDTGFFRVAANNIGVSIGNALSYTFDTTQMGASGSTGAAIKKTGVSSIVPTVIPRVGDPNSGIGSAANDQINFIAGGLTCMSVSEVGGARRIGFYEGSPVALQTGVAVTTAAVHAALVNLRLITA